MAAISWYLTATTNGGWRTVDEATQAAAKSTDGWVVSTGSTNHSEYAVGVERAATTFAGTTPPDGTLDTTLKDAFRTTNAYNGDFASADWTFVFSVQATTNGGAQDGRIRFRLIKAAADGSSATEITAAQQQASLVSNVATTGTFESSLTFNPGAINLANQYLFVQVAWERTGAGGMTTSDINWITGSSASVGTRITSANFTPGAQTLTQSSTFANTNTFHAATVTRGAVTLAQSSRYNNANAFYSPTISQVTALTQATRFDNANTFYAASVTTGAVTLTPSLFTNTNTFHAPAVTPGAVTLTPSLFTNSATFYSLAVTPGAVLLTPARYDNTNTFYSPTVTQAGGTQQDLLPTRVDNTNTFYGPAVAPGSVTLAPTRYDNTNTFFAAAVAPGAVPLTPTRVDNTNTFYSPTVTQAGQVLLPPLFTNTSTFYAATITQAGGVQQDLLPPLFTSTNTFYAAAVTPGGDSEGASDMSRRLAREYAQEQERVAAHIRRQNQAIIAMVVAVATGEAEWAD